MTPEELQARLQIEDSLIPAIHLADDEYLSVQASYTHYCTPRDDLGEWSHVECGFPTFTPSPALLEYCEDPEYPEETVYGYVPVEVVLAEINAHGGVHPADSKE